MVCPEYWGTTRSSSLVLGRVWPGAGADRSNSRVRLSVKRDEQGGDSGRS